MSFRIPRDVAVPAAGALVASALFVALAYLIFVLGKLYERPLIVDASQEYLERGVWHGSQGLQRIVIWQSLSLPSFDSEVERRSARAPYSRPHHSATDGAVTFSARSKGGVSYAARAPEHCAPDKIKARLEALAAQCGAVEVISTWRKNARVRGSGKPSLHRFCESDKGAVDFRVGNYKCARQALADWQGGLSTDPFGVGHLHIDIRRAALRFAHRRAPRGVRVEANVMPNGGTP